MLTQHQQLTGLNEVRDLMLEENWEAAQEHLLALIRATPSESRYYPVFIGTANWLKPLNQPHIALRQLLQFLLTQDAVLAA